MVVKNKAGQCATYRTQSRRGGLWRSHPPAVWWQASSKATSLKPWSYRYSVPCLLHLNLLIYRASPCWCARISGGRTFDLARPPPFAHLPLLLQTTYHQIFHKAKRDDKLLRTLSAMEIAGQLHGLFLKQRWHSQEEGGRRSSRRCA